MKKPDSLSRSKEEGYVLIIGLVFLAALTIGAVALMTGATQDEKMSGNTKRSADAFMAAEAGMYAAVDQMDQAAWYGYTCEDNVLTDSNGVVYSTDPDDENAQVIFIPTTSFGSGAEYRVIYAGECSVKTGTADGVDSLRLISFGTQMQSSREIHFNLKHGSASWPAVFVNEDPVNPQCSFDFGSSSAYRYDGAGGPAISTNSTACRDSIIASDNNSGKLVGGVITNNPAPDFTKPTGLESFYSDLMDNTDADRIIYATANNQNQAPKVLKQALPSDLGTPGDPSTMKTTIVHGDLDITGGLSGAGVLVVTGTAKFGGTPHWDGIIMVLGGQVDIGGGGTTNGLSGTLMVSNIHFPGFEDDNNNGFSTSPEYGKAAPWVYDSADPVINWDVSGGGTARYTYGCQNLMDATSYLKSNNVFFPGPDSCNGAGAGGTFGAAYVFDWYEDVNQ